ncbi:hypothetical protein TWF694_006936 [Orbilia ellipsospora]|uniref:Nucleoside phosphorylase domain-containing protein n=1 Tax=Orbilia ellipsospora TaxID=2528407 RepID=A0AAV9XLN9_9PEZI
MYSNSVQIRKSILDLLENLQYSLISRHEHPQIPRDESDHNVYEFGRLGHHNLIIASLRSGVYGTNLAASVATNLRRSFPDVTSCLVVGIGGGAPLLSQNDIRLGDVVVGHPASNGTHGGVLLKADYLSSPNAFNEAIEGFVSRASVDEVFGRPDAQSDRLFEADYDHPTENESCQQCDHSKVVVRRPRKSHQSSVVHYGLVASGNQVMKNGARRDQLSKSVYSSKVSG